MKIRNLNAQERSQSGFTHKFVLTSADLTAAATTQSVQIFPSTGTFPAGHAVCRVGWRLPTSFAGGAASALTASIGDSGSGTALLSAASILGTNTPITHRVTNTAKVYTSADDLVVAFTATGANVSTLTSGELDILLEIRNFEDEAIPA